MDMTSSKNQYRVPTAAVSCYLGNLAASSELQNDQWWDFGSYYVFNGGVPNLGAVKVEYFSLPTKRSYCLIILTIIKLK